MSKPTPGLWRVVTEPPALDRTIVAAPDGTWITDTGLSERAPAEAEANADLIVRAVNAHDDLVEALDRTLEELWRFRGDLLESMTAGATRDPDDVEDPDDRESVDALDATINGAREALAKARGES